MSGLKTLIVLCVTVLFIMTGCSKKQEAADAGEKFLNTTEKTESYVFGTDIAIFVKTGGDHQTQFSTDLFFAAFEDVMTGNESRISAKDMRKIFSDPDSIEQKMESVDLAVVTTEVERQSYLIGLYHSNMVLSSPETFDYESFKSGFNDEINGNPPLLSAEEMQAVRVAGRKRIQRLHKNAEQSLSDEDRELINREFLEQNSKREKVRTLRSGLQYAVIKEGDGRKITGNETLTVEYRGYLIDGREFDNSFSKGSPVEFSFSDNILFGWKEGLKEMKVGSRYKFFLPPELAYGDEGFRDIPPHSVLIFDIEIIEAELKK